MNINCMIVDDEPIARELLASYIARIPGFNLVKSCINAAEAYEGLLLHTVDLLFLDIRMPVTTGTDFLRSLRNPPLVIFTTAYPEYAVEGFELDSVDYLMKPITFDRFFLAVQKVTGRVRQLSDVQQPAAEAPCFIFIRQDTRLTRILFEEIRYIQAERDFCQVFLTGRKLLAGMHLKMFEELLPGHQFLRVHRSYIINISSVQAIRGNMAEIGKDEIPIGANYKEALFARLRL